MTRRRSTVGALLTAGLLGMAAVGSTWVGGAPLADLSDASPAAGTGDAVAASDSMTTGWAGTGKATTSADQAAADAKAATKAAEEMTGAITFSVPSGTFQDQLSVSLSSSVAGAQIRYTTNGQLPSPSSTLYSSPVQITRTTQLRAQPFVDGVAAGAPGTAVYIARSINATHDMPLLVMDVYGKGKPGDSYVDTATMLMEPKNGSTSLAAQPTFATRAGIHLRGQSSRTFEKAPYRVEFRDNGDDDADLPVLGMPAGSDWVLRGPFTDKSLVRDALVYDLSRDMGMAAPRFAFVEFYLNTDSQGLASNDYQGVYMLVETIKNSKNRLDLKKLKAEHTTEPDITGGYIIKFEWMAAEEPTIPCSGSNCWNYLEIQDPTDLTSTQKNWLTQYVKNFNTMMHSGSVGSATSGYRSWIDTRSFVDQVIINELTRDMDAYVRSTYFYKDRGGKLTAGPQWDFDLSFGVGGSFQNTQTSGWQYQQTRTPVATDWYTVLLKDASFVNEVRARWKELRTGLLSTSSLNNRINSLTTPLTNGAARNFQRWPNLTTPMIGFFRTGTASTWQGQVSSMRDWMTQRINWLDSGSGWNINGQVTPTGNPTGTPTGTPTNTPTNTPSNTPTSKGCAASYKMVNQWGDGFQVEVTVTAAGAPITGWTVKWNFTGGQKISSSWSAEFTSSGNAMTAKNASYNGSLGSGASTTFGFVGTGDGTGAISGMTCSAS